MTLGKLYGVGVGPGASDLMTLRAVHCLQKVDCIAIPRRDQFSPSAAWRIAQPNVGEVLGQERLLLNFPMTKDPVIIKPAWDAAFKAIGERLIIGKSVAFISEGDPFVYSTFIYLFNAAPKLWPGVEIEVVTGVSSLYAVPGVAGMPVADGQERIAVIPASYGLQDFKAIVRLFDTILLIKVSSVMHQIVELLQEEGLLDHAVYVSKATMEEEKIIWDLASIKNDRCDYFSMVVICKKNRSDILEDKNYSSSPNVFRPHNGHSSLVVGDP